MTNTYFIFHLNSAFKVTCSMLLLLLLDYLLQATTFCNKLLQLSAVSSCCNLLQQLNARYYILLLYCSCMVICYFNLLLEFLWVLYLLVLTLLFQAAACMVWQLVAIVHRWQNHSRSVKHSQFFIQLGVWCKYIPIYCLCLMKLMQAID